MNKTNKAKEYLLNNMKVSEYELMKDGGLTIDDLIMDCPFCDEKQMIRDENGRLRCFACDRKNIDESELSVCSECERYFVATEDDGCICPDCIEAVLRRMD